MKPTGRNAVMAQRREPPDSLDFFPTPPWATRALLQHVIPDAHGTAWEPACGEGHMAAVLEERFARVIASDVHSYGGHYVGSFVGVGIDVIACPRPRPDWVITNPPFNLAVEFAERCVSEAGRGFALLLRTSWLEGVDRYQRIFESWAPEIVAPFVERVPMTKGRWDPQASTATSYAWFVWRRLPLLPGQTTLGSWSKSTSLIWIPPGCRQRLTRPDDVQRFASVEIPHQSGP
tara:strand:- start:9013 stop:9711 length:699 start_codon:yes stop_codon:yes gene_type:complete